MFAQISPGDLTTFHANLEGMSNCTKCHVLGDEVTNHKCLDCHKEIKELQNSSKGYHSSQEVKGKNCWNCHSEHHGRNFRIINFNKDKFDHNKTAFQLTGKHLSEACINCHKQPFIQNNFVKNRKNTFLGLDGKCISCHYDFHQGTLKTECLSCHNTDKFRPATKFNHDQASFKLSGSHSSVDCIKCHIKVKENGKDFQKFKGIAFNSCSNCHKDVHQGKFGSDCKSCHSITKFNDINRSAFNHDKTKFSLLGKHKSVQCQACHNNDLNSKPKHDKCSDCHKDFHKGDFVTVNNIGDCKNCHNENGFSPSFYTLEDHNKSKFQLTGAHLAVPCKNCHYNNNDYHFRKIGLECIDCHKNIHGSELSSMFMPDNNCLACHQTSSWKSIKYDHTPTGFKLLGMHSQVKCKECHIKESKYLFASVKPNCEYCHKDIHNGQFKEEKSSDCSRCHSFNNWLPDKFNHSATKFSIEGAHIKVPCIACHKKAEINNISFINYKLEEFKCASCHQ